MKNILFLFGVFFSTIAMSQSINYTFSQGEKLLKDKHYDQAIEKFKFVVKKDPTFYEAYYDMGLAYQLKGDEKNAYATYKKATMANSNYSDAYEKHLALAIKNKDYDAALYDLKNLIRLHPQKNIYYEKRALIYHNTGNDNKAKQDWEKASTLQSKNAEVYYNLALIYEKEKNEKKFVENLNKAISLKPDLLDALYKRGTYYYNKKKIGLAIKDFEKIYSIKPTYKNDILLYLARGYSKTNKCDKALVFFNEYLKKTHSRDSELFIEKGICQKKLKNYKKAISSFNKAIALDNKNVKAYVERALLYSETGKDRMAERDFSKAIELDKKNPLPYFKRGVIKFEKQKYKEALEDLNKAVKYAKKNVPAEYYYYRGACYFNMGEVNKACNDLTKASDMGYKKAAQQKKEICL